jgi:hypothetical protein
MPDVLATHPECHGCHGWQLPEDSTSHSSFRYHQQRIHIIGYLGYQHVLPVLVTEQSSGLCLHTPGTAFHSGVQAKARLMEYFDPHLRQMWLMRHGRQPPHQRCDDDHNNGQGTSQVAQSGGAAGAAAAPAGPSDGQGTQEASPRAPQEASPRAAHNGSSNQRVSTAAGSTQGGYDPTSSIIYGMLRSGFSWEQLRGNCFQMFFAGG